MSFDAFLTVLDEYTMLPKTVFLCILAAMNACLILDDGSLWPGNSFGAPPPSILELNGAASAFDGEVVFNTGMTGYHEIITDPSYTGQIVLMTHPHIGNYGVDDEWCELGPGENRERPTGTAIRGLVVRSLYDGPVPEGRGKLSDFLARHGVCGLSEVDSRGLTLRIRAAGSRNGVIVAGDGRGSIGESAKHYLDAMPSMKGLALADSMGTRLVTTLNPGNSPHVAVLDCGVKMNIVRELVNRDCWVSVLPSNTGVDQVMNLGADALLFSNGPGDPEPLREQVELAKKLMGRIPQWGICLGHQILALAVGGKTYKMTFGHHGTNHPVRDEVTGRVFVTSQNHGFAVDESSLPDDVQVSFRSMNDGSVEGIFSSERRIMGLQYHPEAAPGPLDSTWFFDALLDGFGVRP